MAKINADEKLLLDNILFGITYDYDKNESSIWVNSPLYLTGRIRELSPTKRGKFLEELTDLAHLYLVCKGNKKLQRELLNGLKSDKNTT